MEPAQSSQLAPKTFREGQRDVIRTIENALEIYKRDPHFDSRIGRVIEATFNAIIEPIKEHLDANP